MKPQNRKWVIVVTMLIAIICNYFDRQLLSILKPEILTHFGIGDYGYSIIVNLFLVCYTIMYFGSGLLVDKLGPKVVMFGGIVVWSAACIGAAYAPNVWVFGGCRAVLGLAEPTVFTAQLLACTLWFERRERGRANSICAIGGSVGAIIAPIIIAWLMTIFGSHWQNVFEISGFVGLFIALVWWAAYQTPPKEVLDKTTALEGDTKTGASFTFKGLFKTHTLYGCLIIRLVSDPVWYFICFWMPGFVRNICGAHGMSNEQSLEMSKILMALPYLVGMTGGFIASFWSDIQVSKGKNALRSRKIVLYGSACIAPLLVLVPLLSNATSLTLYQQLGGVIAIFALVAVMCLTWLYTVPLLMSENFPSKNVGTVMGICCGSGSIGAILFNSVLGIIPTANQHYLFYAMATLHIIASIALWKLVRVERPENYR